jgi:anti-anti-sigma regulatory factor
MSRSTSLIISKQNDVTVIGLKSECAQLGLYNLINPGEVLEAAQNADPPLVVVDLSKAASITSSFLMFLVRASRRVNPLDERRFAVSGLTRQCALAFKAARFEQLWELFDSKDEAVRALSGGTF